MSSTPFPRRLKQQVYVDVPPSPFRYTLLNNKSAPTHLSSTQHKENAPLRPSHANTTWPTVEPISVRKRRLSERDISDSTTSTKKLKLTNAARVSSPMATATSIPKNSVPHGLAYCHQCGRKRDASAYIRCTSKETLTALGGKVTKGRRCTIKFCKACLKNRYGEDINAIKSKGIGKRDESHVDTSDYIFQCPKCRDICNCARCRRLKGLEPTGKLTRAVRRAGADSAAQFLVGGPTMTSIIPGKPIQTSGKPKPKTIAATPAQSAAAEVKDRAVKKSKLKMPLPAPSWTKIPVDFDSGEAETRFQIREFVLRFALIMEPTISNAHQEELDNIGGRSSGRDDSEEMTGWVSETCVRSVILGLLGLIADKHVGVAKRSIRIAMKKIRSSAANLNRIWVILASLRDSISDNEASTSGQGTVLSFPDPLPPPASAVVHMTRSMRSTRELQGATSSIHVSYSAQMIPVLKALIDAAFDTEAVRKELDHGITDEKDVAREAKEATKKEKERWEAERKDIEIVVKDGDKAHSLEMKRKIHEQRLGSIENALEIALSRFALRFAPLGDDSEGRMFWALSPGVGERSIALDFIGAMASGTSEMEKQSKKGKKRGRSWGEGERSAMGEWSWFVAVWGKKPQGLSEIIKRDSRSNTNSGSSNTSEDEDGDENVEKWWGFWQPDEIRKVADWVAVKSGLDPDEISSGPSSSLVKGLKEYAALLEWRICENKYELTSMGNNSDSANGEEEDATSGMSAVLCDR